MEAGNLRKLITAIFVLIAIAVISALARIYIDWLWYDSLGFKQVFITTILSRWGIGIAVFLIVFVFLLVNLLLTRRYSRYPERLTTENGREIIFLHPPTWETFLQSKTAFWLIAGSSLLIALLFGSIAAEKWLTVQQYFHAVDFNIADPIFQKDLSFYFFNLSLYEMLYGLAMPLMLLTILVVGVFYFLTSAVDLIGIDWRAFNWPKRHLAVLLGMIFLLKAWGYKLSMYGILYSPSGVVYGAGYTDIHARLLAYKVLMVAAVVVAAIILINMFIQKLSWIAAGVAGWLVLALILGSIYPYIVQKLSVEPNELERESPYIAHNIRFTRAAYNLDKIETEPFNINYSLSADDLKANMDTIRNIRLWDWQPLQSTYKAIQEIRTYYAFNDVDIDRYVVNGQYRQVMLAAREMDQEKLPSTAQTWVNKHLKYTHGYGVAMSPVNEVAQEGLPRLFIKDIPPRSSVDIKINRPEIYYGEKTDSYVVVNTKTKEFDYPMGEVNAECIYREKSGVRMGGLLKRLIFAWVFSDYRLLFSTDVTPDSQILYYRQIMYRAQKIAPFLKYDQDPYIVISRGRLYWIIDAYTVGEMYPYSEPYYGHYNYIRNSVKVVIDAYNGKTRFYMADAGDPLIKCYARIFPGLFKPIEEMPGDLRNHVRYPEDLFLIQARMYSVYHMTDVQVFYNKEDRWNIPQEVFGAGSQVQEMEPYYIIMRLPDEPQAEYILMIPFTPNTKENMIGWLCARSDGDNYGKLKVFDFPKQELIYGPMQVESRINQNSEIAQQLTLWDQKGSSVYRGNLLVVPINRSVLYIEPIYLEAERQTKIPELRRIIAVFGDKVVMEPTLNDALARLFSQQPGQPEVTEPQPVTETESIRDIAVKARAAFKNATKSLQSGDWAGFGNYLKEVETSLDKLVEKTGGND